MNSVINRFESKYAPEPNTGCWLWHGAIDGGGYGRFSSSSKTVIAHRFSYEMANGQIPEGLEIDHLCRVRCCVNPDHLEAVTARVNTLRSSNACANNSQKSHCSNGHEFSSENTYQWSGRRGRSCRSCHAENERARRAKRKGKVNGTANYVHE